MEELLQKSIAEVRGLLKSGEITSVELTRFYLDRITKYDGLTRCYIRLTEKMALEKAAEADKRIREGHGRRAYGHPFRHEGHPLHQRGRDHMRFPDP